MGRRGRRTLCFGLPALLGVLVLGCPTDPPDPPCPICDASVPDGSSGPDGAPGTDAGPGEGPIITFVSPAAGATVTGPTFVVEVNITDVDGVQPNSVTCAAGSVMQAVMAGIDDTWYCTVGVAGLDGGALTIEVSATDNLENDNTESLDLDLDVGPIITFIQPIDGATVTGNITIQFEVDDPNFGLVPGSVAADVNGLPVEDLAEIVAGEYNGTFVTDDPMFAIPDGTALITARATNDQGTVGVTAINVFLDNSGPDIVFIVPLSGQLVGDVVDIQVEISDPSNVVGPLTLAWVGLSAPFGLSGPASPGAGAVGTYTGQFDTNTLPVGTVSTFISVQATDGQGNTSVFSVLVELDNARPVLELDPPDMALCDISSSSSINPCPSSPTGFGEVSWPFDPTGDLGVEDATAVDQLIAIRAEVRDYGNPGFTTGEAGVVDSSVMLYLLDDPSVPLVIDIDDPPDGVCDVINPDVIPGMGGSILALAVPLVPVVPHGSADFMSLLLAPEPLIFPDSLTLAIPDPPDVTVPALFVVGPVLENGFEDLGNLFDTLQLSDGPACLAVSAEDDVGNEGVSPPLRICIRNMDPLACMGWTPPNCTGTMISGSVDAGTPCTALVHSDFNPIINYVSNPGGMGTFDARIYLTGF